MTNRVAWKLVEAGKPLRRVVEPTPEPGAGEVLVRIAGCGVCHTDLGFFHGHVATRAPLPLTLGHEIAGTVIATGPDAAEWLDREVLVAAVIACRACDFCRAGRGNLCRHQLMPGNDIDGGFAATVVVPATGLYEIDTLPEGCELADLAVIADAVTTPLQAIRRAGVTADDLVVVVGTGGVGSYAVQIAAASGARVIGIDVSAERLEALHGLGLEVGIDASGLDRRELRAAVRAHARALGFDRAGWKIFECSGTPGGQETAWSLLGPAATLAVVGYAPVAVTVRLSNLMAFDATAFGSWGCPPELYPHAIDLVIAGAVDVRPLVRRIPLDRIEQAFEITDAASEARRIVLIPEQ